MRQSFQEFTENLFATAGPDVLALSDAELQEWYRTGQRPCAPEIATTPPLELTCSDQFTGTTDPAAVSDLETLECDQGLLYSISDDKIPPDMRKLGKQWRSLARRFGYDGPVAWLYGARATDGANIPRDILTDEHRDFPWHLVHESWISQGPGLVFTLPRCIGLHACLEDQLAELAQLRADFQQKDPCNIPLIPLSILLHVLKCEQQRTNTCFLPQNILVRTSLVNPSPYGGTSHMMLHTQDKKTVGWAWGHHSLSQGTGVIPFMLMLSSRYLSGV